MQHGVKDKLILVTFKFTILNNWSYFYNYKTFYMNQRPNSCIHGVHEPILYDEDARDIDDIQESIIYMSYPAYPQVH